MRSYARMGLAITMGVALLTVGAAGAGAASIVYVKGGNVYVATADGTQQRQITGFGSKARPFASPSMSDKGDITSVVPYPLRQFVTTGIDGRFKNIGGLGLGGTGNPTGPIEGQVSPAGGLIVYWYIHSDCCYSQTPWVAFARTDRTTGDDVFGHFEDVTNPRWLSSPNTMAGMVSSDGEGIFVEQEGRADAVSWIAAPAGTRIVSFDESRAADRVVAEIGPPIDQYSEGESHQLALFRVSGAAPGGTPEQLCTSTNIASATHDAFPRFSPDGERISWSNTTGIYVSPTPTAPSCTLHPKLIVRGGSQASWGKAGFCSALKGVPAQRCAAKETYQQRLAACSTRGAKQRAKCTADATVAYHRGLKTADCNAIRSKNKREACLRDVRKIRK